MSYFHRDVIPFRLITLPVGAAPLANAMRIAKQTASVFENRSVPFSQTLNFVSLSGKTTEELTLFRVRMAACIFWLSAALHYSQCSFLRRVRNVSVSSSSMKVHEIALAVANVVGIVVYLILASRGWRIPEEQGLIPIVGEPFVWALALPVLGLFILVDSIWGVLLVRERTPEKWRWWLATVIAWVIAIGIDFSHH
jgi:hypothetical protein